LVLVSVSTIFDTCLFPCRAVSLGLIRYTFERLLVLWITLRELRDVLSELGFVVYDQRLGLLVDQPDRLSLTTRTSRPTTTRLGIQILSFKVCLLLLRRAHRGKLRYPTSFRSLR